MLGQSRIVHADDGVAQRDRDRAVVEKRAGVHRDVIDETRVAHEVVAEPLLVEEHAVELLDLVVLTRRTIAEARRAHRGQLIHERMHAAVHGDVREVAERDGEQAVAIA